MLAMLMRVFLLKLLSILMSILNWGNSRNFFLFSWNTQTNILTINYGSCIWVYVAYVGSERVVYTYWKSLWLCNKNYSSKWLTHFRADNIWLHVCVIKAKLNTLYLIACQSNKKKTQFLQLLAKLHPSLKVFKWKKQVKLGKYYCGESSSFVEKF